MTQQRYNDTERLISDMDQLQLTNETEVMIYREDRHHEEIVVDLGGQEEQFEELKTLIAFAAGNLCKMDRIAQEYNKDKQFADHYEVAYLRLDAPDTIRITYFGVCENTEFDVVFQVADGDLILRSFGTIKDIASDWYKTDAGYR